MDKKQQSSSSSTAVRGLALGLSSSPSHRFPMSLNPPFFPQPQDDDKGDPLLLSTALSLPLSLGKSPLHTSLPLTPFLLLIPSSACSSQTNSSTLTFRFQCRGAISLLIVLLTVPSIQCVRQKSLLESRMMVCVEWLSGRRISVGLSKPCFSLLLHATTEKAYVTCWQCANYFFPMFPSTESLVHLQKTMPLLVHYFRSMETSAFICV